MCFPETQNASHTRWTRNCFFYLKFKNNLIACKTIDCCRTPTKFYWNRFGFFLLNCLRLKQESNRSECHRKYDSRHLIKSLFIFRTEGLILFLELQRQLRRKRSLTWIQSIKSNRKFVKKKRIDISEWESNLITSCAKQPLICIESNSRTL